MTKRDQLLTLSEWGQNILACERCVIDWCLAHANQISRAFMYAQADQVVFYIIPTSDQYDFDLGYQQADIEFDLNTKSKNGYCETRQVPGWEIDTFVASSAVCIYPSSAE